MIERRWADWTVADPRKAPGLPLFLVQTEAPRAEKNFLETGQPAYLKVWIGKRWWGRGGGAYELWPLEEISCYFTINIDKAVITFQNRQPSPGNLCQLEQMICLLYE